jgi:hypothetical protein
VCGTCLATESKAVGGLTDGALTFVQQQPLVLVFLPNTNELQRFVLSGAMDGLRGKYRLQFVFSDADSDAMLSAAPGLIVRENSHILDIPARRFKLWSTLFKASCYSQPELSASFRLRYPQPIDRLEPGLAKLFWSAALRYAEPVLKRLPAKTIDGLARRLGGEKFAEAVRHRRNSLQQAERPPGDLEPYQPMVKLIEEVRPLFCVIPTSFLDQYCNDLIAAGRAHNYVVLALQSGWDNLSSKGVLPFKPHFLGTWGWQSLQHAKVIQSIPKSSSARLGAPHYEALRPVTAEVRAAFRQRLGAAPDETLILFGGSFRQFDETSVLQRLDRAIERGELGRAKVVYRPHPWRADRVDEADFFSQSWAHVVFDPEMKDRYLESKARAGHLKSAPMYDMHYLAALLSSVDVVMSPMSTLLLEALIMERPTMAIAFGDDKHDYHPGLSAKMTHFEGLADSGALIWCDDASKFEGMARALCDRPFNAKVRNKLLSQLVNLDPSTSYSDRLLDFARTVVEPQARLAAHRRTLDRRAHVSQTYGALELVQDYIGDWSEHRDIPGYWMHGWIPAYHNIHPAFVALHKKAGQGEGYDYLAQIEQEKAEVMQWVSRQDQVDYLRSEGYLHVRAIGLPFCYLPPTKIDRVPGSLLVMPPHGHRTHGSDDPLAEELARQIADKAPLFSEVCVCLNVVDFARNDWRGAFEKRGIQVIVGADMAEPNTLLRLKRIMSRFEFVTTNGFGSHIAYAAACGAKVSVFGPFAEFPLDRVGAAHAMRMFPELGQPQVDLCSEQAMRTNFPFLFAAPEKAVDLTAWGLAQIGADNRLSPAAMREAFGWAQAAPAEKLSQGAA